MRDQHARVMRAALVALFTVFVANAATAQNAPAPASTAPATQEPYIDRVLPASSTADSTTDDVDTRDTTGWPRSIRIELQWAESRSNGFTSSGTGLALRGTLDTPNFGGLSFDGQLGGNQRISNAANRDARSYALTLTQIGMPLARGWAVNNALGIIAPSQVSLARQQLRIGLPTRALEGASTEFYSPDGITVNGSIGRVGQFEGYPSASFRSTGGNYASVGGQFRAGAGNGVSTTAINTAFVRDARNELGLFANTNANTSTNDFGKADFDNLFVAQRYQQGDIAIQGNVVRSTTSATGGKENASGYWLDATLDSQRTRHSAGLFYLEPNLNWGGLAMNNDVEGGYYRYSYSTLRLSGDISLEALRPVAGTASSGAFGSGSLRYQLSRDVSIGGGATLREFDGRGWQTYGYVQSQNNLGIGRAQLDFTEATTGERSQSLAVDQTFRELDGLRLSTSLSLSRQTAPTFKRNTVSLSVAGGIELFNNFILDANIQGRTTLSGPRDNALFTTIGVAWQFARYWSLNANAIFGTGRYDTGVILDPLAPPTLITNRPNQRSFLVTLRYEDRAGSIAAPLGGRVGSGGAPVSGMVFLDANNNGVADASEIGVANLTVLLDGRFSARTDAQGRFEFGFVGAGPHSLTVVTDNLPLPWTVNNDGLTRVTVSPREAQRVNIPAVKMP
jgi:hypothetical protein